MIVFISWSGQRSHKVANLLKEWLKCVLQATKPWVSSEDIDRGAVWFTEILDTLKECEAGIVCLTAKNMDEPWVLFEAGALAKGLRNGSDGVCTFLVDIASNDVKKPLAHFNHTTASKDDMKKLVITLNGKLSEAVRLDENVLNQVFETNWPHFEEKFNEILIETEGKEKMKAVARTDTETLGEVLETVRSIDKQLSNRVPLVPKGRAISQYWISSPAVETKRVLFDWIDEIDEIDIAKIGINEKEEKI